MTQWEYCSIRHTHDGIEYALYQTNGAYVRLLSGPSEEDPNYVTAWQNALATLGMFGWEAINTLQPGNAYEDWYFKRPIQPGNQYPPHW